MAAMAEMTHTIQIAVDAELTQRLRVAQKDREAALLSMSILKAHNEHLHSALVAAEERVRTLEAACVRKDEVLTNAIDRRDWTGFEEYEAEAREEVGKR
jgi:hypothetical protein